MAGDPTSSGGGAPPPPFDPAAPPPVPPTVDGEIPVDKIDCPACGASLAPRSLGVATTFACEFCGSVFDRTHEGVALVEKAEKGVGEKPTIPLGKRGTLEGVEWEAIGFVVRRGSAEGESWSWREYLLFNPYHGFRFLVSFETGWSLVRKVAGMPTPQAAGAPAARPGHAGRLGLKGDVYTREEAYSATVVSVLGEFTWRVRRGETAQVTDYKSGPRVLCEERTAEEVTYSLGQPIPAGQVGEAFGLKLWAGVTSHASLDFWFEKKIFGFPPVIWALGLAFCLISSCVDLLMGSGGGGGSSGRSSSGFRGGK